MAVLPNPHNVVALLLAAGLSKRAGPKNKLTAPIPKNKSACPIVRASAKMLLLSSARQIIVVTGYQSKKIQTVLSGLNLTFVHNPNFGSGMARSLATGIGAVPENAAGVIVALGDMPCLSPKTLDALITAFVPTSGKTICVPVQAGKQGNPVLFGRRHFIELTSLNGDRGGKTVVKKTPGAVKEVMVNDPGIHVDFDVV